MKASYLLVHIFVLLFAVNLVHAQAPASPTNGNATAISRTELLISWQDNSNNEDFFLIFDYPELLTVSNLSDALVGSVDANSTSATITGLLGGSRVQYAIVAYNQQRGISSYTETPEVRMPDEIKRYGHQAIVGQSFSAEFYTDDSGLQNSASTTISGLPSWATFNKATRFVSGTPDAEGVYSLNLDINYSDGFKITETVPLRVLPAVSEPILADTLPSPEYHPNIETQSIDLSAYFTDPDCSRAVRMTFSNLGIVDIILYENATPDTVSNFLEYVSEDPDTGQPPYNGAMIHRSIPGFVIQGGGFRPIGDNNFASVPVLRTVDNEPGLENVRGTISMAKQGGNPDSATNQWFISLADNRANLDFQNGGFTAFGRVAGNGMDVIDNIASLPIGNYSNIRVDNNLAGGLLSDCPMNVTTTNAPTNMEQDKLVVLESAVEIDPLTYSIVSNSDPSVAEATVSDGTLQVTPLKSGTCTLKIRATDLDDNQIEEDVAITVTSWTFDDWSVAQELDAGQGGILDDADGDSLPNFIEYALFGDAKTSTPSLTKSQKVSAGTSATEDYLAIEFSTRNGIQDTRVCVEAVDQLSPDATWTEIWNSSQGSDVSQVHSANVATDHIDWIIRDTEPNDSRASRFMRVRVERVDSQ